MIGYHSSIAELLVEISGRTTIALGIGTTHLVYFNRLTGDNRPTYAFCNNWHDAIFSCNFHVK